MTRRPERDARSATAARTDEPRAAGEWARMVGAIATVAGFGAVFAHYFRESIHWMLERLSGTTSPTKAAAAHPAWMIGLLVTVSVFVAAEIAWRVQCRRGERAGLGAIADAARGEGVGPSVRCAALRAGATWIAMSGMSSLGREAPILETGGALGAYAGRRLRLSTAHLAIVGVSSAFASAYHAPVAALFYIREHVVPGADRRATTYAAVGGGLGYAVTMLVFRTRAPFDNSFKAPHDALSLRVMWLALIGIVPAFLAIKAFFALRKKVNSPHTFVAEHRRLVAGAAALLAGTMVAWLPLVSGNGMDLIRHSAVTATVDVALVMLVAKLVATLATIGSGAPGGVFSPTLTVAAGAGLLVFHLPALHGVVTPGAQWDAMLVLMAVAVAVGTHAPIAAMFVVPELANNWNLLPFTIGAVVITMALQEVADEVQHRTRAVRRRLDLLAELDA